MCGNPTSQPMLTVGRMGCDGYGKVGLTERVDIEKMRFKAFFEKVDIEFDARFLDDEFAAKGAAEISGEIL